MRENETVNVGMEKTRGKGWIGRGGRRSEKKTLGFENRSGAVQDRDMWLSVVMAAIALRE